MKLKKAIEILEHETQFYPQKGTDNGVDALKLGIEALKAIKGARYYPLPNSLKQLPGETTDEET